MTWGLHLGPRVNIGAVRRFDPGVTLHLDFLAPGPAAGPRLALDFRRGRGWLRDAEAPGEYVGVVRQRPPIPGLTLALSFADGVYAAEAYVRAPIPGLTLALSFADGVYAATADVRAPAAGLSLALSFADGVYAAAPYVRRPAEGLTLALSFADDIYAG